MFILHTTRSSFIVDVDLANPPPTYLHIDRVSGHASVQQRQTIDASSRTERIVGIYGILALMARKYLIVVTAASQVATLMASSIKMVTNTKIIPYNDERPAQWTQQHYSDETRYLAMVTAQLKAANYYFSYDSDLTHSMQRSIKLRLTNPLVPASQVADDRFFWNKYLNNELIEAQAYNFVLPAINGYVYHQHLHYQGNDCAFILISRRSVERAGKRFVTRGLDLHGHAANFAETEQIVVSTVAKDRTQSTIHSFLQTRGSIPVLWDQPVTLKYTPKIIVGKNASENELSFRRHIEAQIERYGRNICINLINQKGSELVLVKEFTALVNKFNSEKSQPSTGTHPVDEAHAQTPHSLSSTISGTTTTPVKLINWDFHHECKGMKFENVSKLIALIGEAEWATMGHFTVRVTNTMVSGKRTIAMNIIKEQKGIFRTNCIDCLDRTNVVQAAFAKHVLLQQLQTLTESAQPSSLSSLPTSMIAMFNTCWANNADAMSVQYSGTGALKTDFTRTGKRTIRGALQDGVNSLKRYYYNNFRDGRHQDSIDLILGMYQPSLTAQSPFTKKEQRSVVEFFARFTLAILILLSLYSYLMPYQPLKIWVRFPVIVQFVLFLLVVILTGTKTLVRYGSKYVDKPRLRTAN